MTNEKITNDRFRRIREYFSPKEWGIIVLLSVLTVIIGTVLPRYLVADGKGIMPAFVHGILKFPSPSAGFIVFGGLLCFWFILGLLLIRKPWTAIVMSILVMAIDFLIGQQPVPITPTNLHSLDAIMLVAIIIEILTLFSWEKSPLKYVMPVILAGFGAIILFVYFTVSGQDRIGYVLIAILAFGYAVVCYQHPLKFLAAGTIASMCYLGHFWIFFSASVKTLNWSPTMDITLVHLCIVAVGGALFATVAYGVEKLLKSYTGHN
jgi:hypothetical protein